MSLHMQQLKRSRANQEAFITHSIFMVVWDSEKPICCRQSEMSYFEKIQTFAFSTSRVKDSQTTMFLRFAQEKLTILKIATAWLIRSLSTIFSFWAGKKAHRKNFFIRLTNSSKITNNLFSLQIALQKLFLPSKLDSPLVWNKE